ncbi:MAG: HK97 gp10 family phage protein [bacterium]|nr:HK97 gp10 family phage protein [bacterium]
MADLTAFRRDYLLGVERRLVRGAAILENRLKANSPVAAVGGGTMQDSITVRAAGFTVSVVVGVEYASFTIEDQQPHVIVARGRALVFNWPKIGGKQPKFFKSVQHPGTSGTVDWYHDVLDIWDEILEQVA